ncbi:thioredoxin reductase [Paenibacillus antri]|uniref:Thioredoxin reductase n=1 Tax=Paenibacillus antri TaxID=2582848 RepID=A0A5R9G5F6_9BACL|nr:FAD-dependent oxidoreductase [Paenibacillus antri]TLS51592.1 thioredoxin reductase [Paenibacillus antri]
MKVELAIVGAGISGAAAALLAKASGLERVLATEYEDRMGGLLRGLFAGPSFAEEAELMRRAAELPYEFRFRAAATSLFFDEDRGTHLIGLQGPAGHEDVEAERVLLCSGAFEKPREARRIPGSRPAGVMTPTMSVGLLDRGYVPGRRVLLAGRGRVVDGAERRLKERGVSVERLDPALWDIAGVQGRERVDGVLARHVASGEERLWPCDAFVYAEGRIPCTFYLKGSDIERDENHAVVVDEAGRTNAYRVSAAGSCSSAGDDEHRSSAEQARRALASLLSWDD